MKYLKTFESYSEKEICNSCGCDCDVCDCENCDCGQVTEKKKSKPDFLDLDKDGDKEEPMKKAVKDKEKGLSAKQKKLPEGLRKAIMARKKK